MNIAGLIFEDFWKVRTLFIQNYCFYTTQGRQQWGGEVYNFPVLSFFKMLYTQKY